MPTTYLQITPEDIAPDVILVGDPARAHLAGDLLADITGRGKNREYTWITGTSPETGRPVTVVACGIGAPAWAIAMTELHACGARRLVRVGTAITPVLPLGVVALARSVLRYDRVSEDYLPMNVPVLPDLDLTQFLLAGLREIKAPVKEALFASFSTFYGQMEPLLHADASVASAHATLDQADFRRALALGAKAVDMETALVLAFGQRFGLAAASACLCTVTGNGGPNLDKTEQRERELALLRAVFRAFQ